MKKIINIILMLIVFGQTHAIANEWKLDQAHSGVMFEIKHIYSVVRGHFSDFSGAVFFNPDSPEKGKCEFVVKVDSISTQNGKRDNHLRSGDFFSAGKYPEMVFKSSRVKPAGGNKYILEGRMTLKDVTKDMRLELVFLGQKENPFKKNKMVAGFETRFKINRLDFNVGNGKFYKMGVVDKDVDVLISLEMTRDK
ncbi:YceI family protein [Thermodesulfobacteriota bacterium]